LEERILAIEVDVDRPSRLRERAGDARHGLRDDGRHERTKVEPEVETRGVGCAVRDRTERTADADAVEVVGKRVGEANDDLILIRRVIHLDAAGHDRHVVAVAKWISRTAAAHDRDPAERGRIDLHAGPETQRDLLRRVVEFDRPGVHILDVERGRAFRERRDEVERHDPALFELLDLVAAAPFEATNGATTTPPAIEEFVNGRRPR
jgi:hypothetical protein